MKCAVIIPAAGSGSRFGGEVPKQYRLLGGATILQRTIERFLEIGEVREIVVATPKEDPRWEELESSLGDGRLTRVVGGPTRQESVARAFGRLDGGVDVVAVHDAVRPFVSENLFRNLVAAALETGAAIPGVPVGDTIHEIDEESLISRTMTRESLRAVQTPQCFRYEVLRESIERAAASGVVGTDEASLAVRIGSAVKVLPGETANIKITRPEDLDRAERQLEEWSAQ